MINHNKDQYQFTCDIEGKISHLKYTIMPDGKTLDYRSTFVPPELRGQNIANELVKAGLEYAKENGYKVIPSCSFVRAYMMRHPEYNGRAASYKLMLKVILDPETSSG